MINGETTTAHSNQPKEPSTQGTLAEANMPAASITTGMPVPDDDLNNHEQKYITFHGIPAAEILEALPERPGMLRWVSKKYSSSKNFWRSA